ncbi:MAG: tyrosine-type recombinase/integrase [Methylotenera sp.]|nr:tyrosine-type recombinase/integrase [Methylotenera sp.]
MNRYPSAGKGNNWTALELKSIPIVWKGDSISDGGGLTGEVRVTSSNSVTVPFRFAFKLNGKVCWHYCGIYPQDNMATIRKVRDDARVSVKAGIDPRAKKLADKIIAQNEIDATIAEEKQKLIDAEIERAKNLSLQDLYNAWIKDGVSRSDGNKYIAQSFNKHALPSLGKVYVRDLTEHDLRDLYRKIILGGTVATAVELSKDIGQMLRWAEKRKPWRALLIDGNPSELVEIKKLVPKGYTKERKRMLSIDEIKKLKSIFDSTAQSYLDAPSKYGTERPLKKEVQIAMWLCLSTICRIGELLMTEWKHVDFKERTWFIPAANTKGEQGAKTDQIVYLSDFALDQFKQLHILTGDTSWAFPAIFKEGHVCVKSASKQIGDRQVQFKKRSKKLAGRVENNSLVLSDDEEWTPHDLRRTGATLMQQLKVHRDVINLCQNHVIGSKVDRVYLLDEYADEKREAWYKLGDRLEAILSATNVVSLKTA